MLNYAHAIPIEWQAGSQDFGSVGATASSSEGRYYGIVKIVFNNHRQAKRCGKIFRFSLDLERP